jgi:decaprenylphospho-beta-D-ribofuranose 2-oxidase
MIPRGLGRSYGDAAQCAGGTVIDTSAFDTIGTIDRSTGLVQVGGGVSLDALIRAALPLGWFIPVSPGTRQVTLGGAIAADVHGKNHHQDGSFCSHVTSMTLVTPVGVMTVTRESDPELFWATAGGMGLTGIVAEATVRLHRIETAWVEVDSERFDNLDSTMSAMEATDQIYRYSVAWVDCSSRRGGLGRSVLTRGDHAPLEALDPERQDCPFSLPGKRTKRLPFELPRSLVTTRTSRAFNEIWYRKSPRRASGTLVPLTSFLHPLDGLANWNLLYGKRGFVQYQFVVAPRHAEVVRKAISMIAESGLSSPMAVLKRFGPAAPGPLSFPIEGWTLAIDFPVGPPQLPSLLDELDDVVAGVAGRVYLAKDARLRPELLGVMYPRLCELTAVRRRVDPDDILESDLSRRLGLTGTRTT